MQNFRNGETQLLIATDVAARGLDIPALDLVINYDFPSSPKLFVHRVGRTARQQKTGLAISIISQRDLPYTIDLLVFSGRKLKLNRNDQEYVFDETLQKRETT